MLATKALPLPGKVKASVLVLTGANDPLAPQPSMARLRQADFVEQCQFFQDCSN
jgi:hypothetical protein